MSTQSPPVFQDLPTTALLLTAEPCPDSRTPVDVAERDWLIPTVAVLLGVPAAQSQLAADLLGLIR
jgi:hypothetical protein